MSPKHADVGAPMEEPLEDERPKPQVKRTDPKHAPRGKHMRQYTRETMPLHGRTHTSLHDKAPRANRVIIALMVVSLVVAAAQMVVETLTTDSNFVALIQGEFGDNAWYVVAIYVLTLLDIIGLVLVVVLDHRGHIFEARLVIRSLIVLMILGLIVQMLLYGISWQVSFCLIQIVCILAYQVYNDPNLSRPPRFARPRDVKAAREKVYGEDPDRRGFIPLNFFNLFWVFMVGSVVGLVIETLYCAFALGIYKDRTCMLWGPFSPIYGVGAVLMTVAVNSLWHRNASVIFVVTAIVGGALEFFVSWFLEEVFGVWSWDYSGNFLSIGGRTDFAHCCAWGLLGVAWVRLVLPTLMRFVDMIPLRWRASITIVVAAFMLVNSAMTFMAIDCWSERLAGESITTATQQFFATYYGDDYMSVHFATLKMTE